jgi:hypothetical protein
MAGGCRSTVIATMLGHMLRCLYYRERCCVSGGWCKASWIAEIFSIDLRSVKAARRHLVTIGWLQMFDTPQTLCNRWGSFARVSLSWTRASIEEVPVDKNDTHFLPSESPPPSEFSTTKLPPPNKEHREPLQDLKHQKPTFQTDTAPSLQSSQHTEPAFGGMTGVQKQEKENTKKTAIQAPTLSHIVLEDLRDTAGLLVLFEQAHAQQFLGKSESDRLTFLATAEHARVIGSQNPCGLFAALIRRKCWHFVTESDEDAAYKRLKAHLYGSHTPTRGTPPPREIVQPRLSKDAEIVRYVQAELARKGFHGDVFGVVSREDASWTRARWDQAVLELEQA